MAKTTPGTWPAPAASSRGSGGSVRSPAGSGDPRPRAAGPDPARRGACAALAAAVVGSVCGVGWAATPAGERRAPVPAATARRLAQLDPERIGPDDVRDVLARVPAPRIIALQGSVALVTMEPFAEFLVAMGYPARQLADPRDGTFSRDSFGSSEALAGTLAWHYEREGIVPLLIGHSQGGMLAIRTLHELAGAFNAHLAVWNPLRDAPEPRTTIVDPRSGRERPVLGLQVPWASAIATGKLPRLLLGQWSMLERLTQIPDTVGEFTGFAMEWDPIAGNFGSIEPYVATGSAAVRNVVLPSDYRHVLLPLAAGLAREPATRSWIDTYVPGAGGSPPAGVDTTNLIHAADIWHSLKKHWCREAQRLLAATAPS
ncbi:MAG: hypothetical protein IPO75_00340 [Betaproteobacteria bacterium]|nr:hypothetical protein [Betaproteobacteria bacterium]